VTSRDELRAAVEALHERIDAWHAAVVGIADEAPVGSGDALADPRLEDAENRFYEALSTFEERSLPVLGMVPVEEPAEDEEEPGDLAVDDFFLHFVIGVAPGEDGGRLGAAEEIVDQGGFAVVERLEAAGFQVPQFGSSRGDLEAFFDIDEDDEDEGPGGDLP
jgi:hypothetical protein